MYNENFEYNFFTIKKISDGHKFRLACDALKCGNGTQCVTSCTAELCAYEVHCIKQHE